LQYTPEEKRVIYAQNLNKEEVMWKDSDDLKDYRKGILESVLEV
jgi:GTP-binding protein HSR1-related protein